MEQGTNYLPYIGVGFVAIIIGWVIGFFDSNLRASKKIKQAEETAAIAAQEAKERAAEFDAKSAALAAKPVIMDDAGIMRIKNENGNMALELDGIRVNTASMAPEQRRRLIEMLNVMRPWLEGKPAHVHAPATMTPHPSKSAPVSVNPAPPVPQPIPSKPVAAPASAPKKDAAPAAAPTSMVGQINAILQARIASTRFADLGVTMIESPSGGVYVYVGLNRFEGIDSVPDDDIKAVIRSAIAEWEKKYTPGLG